MRDPRYPKPLIGEAEVVEALRARLTEFRGKQYLLAQDLRCSPAMISMVLNGVKPPTIRMAEGLGFRRA